MKFAVIGGDMRQAKLAELLAADGHSVSVFALDKLQFSNICEVDSPGEATEEAECVILPLPVTAGDRRLNAPLSESTHKIEPVFDALRPEQLVCAGYVDALTDSELRSRGIFVIDYFAREELAVSIAVATAEGAIQLIMEETPITLCGSNCLVIGYGRIGKILSHRLRSMGAHVTVSARKCSDITWINAFGYEAADTGSLSGRLSGFDIIVNTVPTCILNEECLQQLKTGCLCLDLASKPGGMDFKAASLLGVKAIWALGLPGEVAPVSAGAAMRDTIYNILQEQGKC